MRQTFRALQCLKALQCLLLLLSLLFAGNLFSQTKTVTGKISDKDGKPVPFASVQLKGKGTGVSASDNGNFSIAATKGDLLVISAMGFTTQEVTITEEIAYNITLSLGESSLNEVVVTALGISREKKSLGYASQQVTGAELNSRPTNNFLNNLSGKVAGLDIKTNSNFGGSTNIILRGTKSISYNNQALIVIDGVAISNLNLNNANTTGGLDGVDFGNSAADIDPNNIESINVLKGAAATALYGSQAANGALIITTKKGKRNQRTSVTINSTTSVGAIDKKTFPTYQKEYGGGYGELAQEDVNGDGQPDYVAPFGDDASYGSKYDPSLMVYQWNAFAPGNPNFGKATPWVAPKNDPSKFFKKSFSAVNSVNINGGDDKNTFNFTYTNHYETGVFPNARITKNTLNGSFSREITDGLKATAFAMFMNQGTIGRNTVGYNNNILTGFRQWWATNVDMNELKQEYFRNRENLTWNMNDPVNGDLTPAYWNNPYWQVYENYPSDQRTRVLTGANISWDITAGLNLLGRVTVDYTDAKMEQRLAKGSHAESFGLAQLNESSGYWLVTNKLLQQTYDLIATYRWKISPDFSANFLAGGTFIKSRQQGLEASTTGGLLEAKKYTLTNSIGYFPPLNTDINFEKSGYYAQAAGDYKKLIFLELTGRRDESSSLPKNNRDYFYYSISSSFAFSELLKKSATWDWLDNAKFRVSYAEVGNDLPPGRLGYLQSTGIINGVHMIGNTDTYVDFSKLKPEKQKSWEAGLEASFLNRRVTLDLSVYKTNVQDLLFSIPQSPASGYRFALANAGETENNGIEVALGLTPVRTANFEWSMNINWARNKNKVVSLNEGRENLQLARFGTGVTLNATKGQPYGTFRGLGYVYKDGQPVLRDGDYLNASDQVIGNIQPDWIGGINNKLSYKNLSLSFLIDIKKGGDLFSLDQSYGQNSGIYPNTAGLNDLGNPKRNPLDQGGGIIRPGVTEDGKPNDVRIDVSSHGSTGYEGYPSEEFIYDASYVKLREASISYIIPEKWLGGGNKIFKGITLSLVGNNLWIIDKKVPYSDPEAGLSSGNIQGYQTGVMPTVRVFSFNAKFNF